MAFAVEQLQILASLMRVVYSHDPLWSTWADSVERSRAGGLPNPHLRSPRSRDTRPGQSEPPTMTALAPSFQRLGSSAAGAKGPSACREDLASADGRELDSASIHIDTSAAVRGLGRARRPPIGLGARMTYRQ